MVTSKHVEFNVSHFWGDISYSEYLTFGEENMDTTLGAKVSSLFDIPERRELHPTGSSVTSYIYEPREDDRRGKKIQYENTYRMEPPRMFRSDKARLIIDDVLKTNLEERKYDPIECSLLAKTLAEEIKIKVKELNFERYKILSVVTIGQRADQGVRVGSRFLWDADRDSFAAGSFSNKHLFAVATVFALYYE
ncbi:hypothetical protein CHS0354_026511 [Potamilus streckersoni]|uniref:Uncharacterized protein n=1 Tax=Potamilus streckersoni TaxID=2493646 RepID=A0AAE0VGM4_9BIVA|nr:hypothetical protein CHS0354_026511 [Potamilus streckersoni]